MNIGKEKKVHEIEPASVPFEGEEIHELPAEEELPVVEEEREEELVPVPVRKG